MAELVYAFDLKSNGEIHMGSSPISGTTAVIPGTQIVWEAAFAAASLQVSFRASLRGVKMFYLGIFLSSLVIRRASKRENTNLEHFNRCYH